MQQQFSFGEILKRHRTGQKYSLRDLESISGVSASFISRLENGDSSPTYDIILRLADSLGVKPAEFFPGHEGFNPSYRSEFGTVLENKSVQVMLRDLATLDPYAIRAIAVATTHWIELLKRGLHPVEGLEGTYRINEKFVEELEDFKGFKK
ncbi:MAG TPA: XRE family transcriptional regulator [Firmicutes bacterium]|nr:XRE family transcriptional regulator [Bacillota bacterium]